MPIRTDPEENEVRALESATDWHGKQVLEIGCGEGRLTLRLAQLGAIVYASDTDPDAITAACKNLPKRFAKRVQFNVGNAERIDHADESFDAVVFAWSL